MMVYTFRSLFDTFTVLSTHLYSFRLSNANNYPTCHNCVTTSLQCNCTDHIWECQIMLYNVLQCLLINVYALQLLVACMFSVYKFLVEI